MTKDNVVQFPGGNEEPPVETPEMKMIKDRLEEAQKHIEILSLKLDNTLSTYGDENRLDLSIPLEALSTSFGYLAAELDSTLPEDALASRWEMRDIITQSVIAMMDDLVSKSNIKLLYHDLYIALNYAIIQYLGRFRVQYTQQEMETNGILENGTDARGEESES